MSRRDGMGTKVPNYVLDHVVAWVQLVDVTDLTVINLGKTCWNMHPTCTAMTDAHTMHCPFHAVIAACNWHVPDPVAHLVSVSGIVDARV